MRLLKSNQFVDDEWQRLADDEPLPRGRPVLVSVGRLLADNAGISSHDDRLGVSLGNTEATEALVAQLHRLSLIVLVFPKFTDGRAYSQARQIRDRLGFSGELRAKGQILPDQLLLMRRCGFDAFEIGSTVPEERWQAALMRFSAFYQPADKSSPVISALRRNAARATAA